MVKTAAKTLKPVFEVATDGDFFIFRSLSTFKNTEIKFKLGEEFEEDRADGKRVKTVVNRDGNKFVQTQFGDKEVKIVREFNGDELVVVSEQENRNPIGICFRELFPHRSKINPIFSFN